MFRHVRRRTSIGAAGLALVLAASGAAVLAPATAAPGPDDIRRDFAATPGTLGPVPDSTTSPCGTAGVPLDVVVAVSGIRTESLLTDLEVTVEFSPVHGWMGDLSVHLISPDGTEMPVFGRTGATSPSSCGDSTDLEGSYTFSDQAATEWTSTAAGLDGAGLMPPGQYRAASPALPGDPVELTPTFSSVPDLNGDWTLRVTDSGMNDLTSITGASLGLTVSEACPDARDALDAAHAALAAAEDALADAQDAVVVAKAALTKANKAVAKAKKKLKKAKKTKNNRKAKVKRAKKALKAKRAVQKAKRADFRAAVSFADAAQADATSAEDAVAAAQADVDAACPS